MPGPHAQGVSTTVTNRNPVTGLWYGHFQLACQDVAAKTERAGNRQSSRLTLFQIPITIKQQELVAPVRRTYSTRLSATPQPA